MTVERTELWRVCDLSRKRVPPVGVCLYRRETVLDAVKNEERFMDINVPLLVARSGRPLFAYVPSAAIHHPNIQTLGGLVRRRLRNLHKVFLPSRETRAFRYLDGGPAGAAKAALLLLLANTPFYFLLRGIVRSVVHRDIACIYEPIAALVVTDALLAGMLRDAEGRRFIKSIFLSGK